jgi:Plasmid pRiA4b ORF-3-like protein.
MTALEHYYVIKYTVVRYTILTKYGMMKMNVYTLKVILIDSEPLVWRRIAIPSEITFQRLHEVIQCVMLWQDYHMFEFVMPDDKCRFVGDQETVDEFNAGYENGEAKPQWQYKLAGKVKIDSLLNKYGQFDYTYDFGDSWYLKIEREAISENYAKPYAACIDGENPAPPEDVGGWDGYQQFLKAFRDPENEQHEEMVEWCEGWKDKFDKRAINAALRKIILKRYRFLQPQRSPR